MLGCEGAMANPVGLVWPRLACAAGMVSCLPGSAGVGGAHEDLVHQSVNRGRVMRIEDDARHRRGEGGQVDGRGCLPGEAGIGALVDRPGPTRGRRYERAQTAAGSNAGQDDGVRRGGAVGIAGQRQHLAGERGGKRPGGAAIGTPVEAGVGAGHHHAAIAGCSHGIHLRRRKRGGEERPAIRRDAQGGLGKLLEERLGEREIG